jgi:hypothetical protein
MIESLKKPTSIAIIILTITTIVFALLYLQKADIVTKTSTEIVQLHEQYDSLASYTKVNNIIIKTHEDSLAKLTVHLLDSINTLSWYKKNWHKTTIVYVDSNGHPVTRIDENLTDSGGTNTHQVTVVDSSKFVYKIKEVYIHDSIYVHDTVTVNKVKDSIQTKIVTVKEEVLKKGRLYGGIGGSVTEKLAIAPEARVGFTYGFTKLLFLDGNVAKTGFTDYSSGYKLAVSGGGKLDF